MKQRVFIIAAMTRSGVIGRNGRLPWKNNHDLSFFTRITSRSKRPLVIVGKITAATLPKGSFVRRSVSVIGRNADFHSLSAALTQFAKAGDGGPTQIAIAGGRGVYEEALTRTTVREAYVTFIEDEYEGDVTMPTPDQWPGNWVQVEAWTLGAGTSEHCTVTRWVRDE